MFENTPATPDTQDTTEATTEERVAKLNELLIALKDAPIEKLSSTPAFLDAVGDIVEGQ